MKTKVTPDQVDTMRNHYEGGMKCLEISKLMDIPYTTVNNWCAGIYKNRPVIHEDVAQWSVGEELKLRHRYSLLPKPINVHGREFIDLCSELVKSPSSVICKIYAMKLHITRLNSKDEEVEEKKVIKRPPPIVTNSHSPFGIADELHAGNRIFK